LNFASIDVLSIVEFKKTKTMAAPDLYEDLLSPSGVAALKGVSQDTVLRSIQLHHDLPAIRVLGARGTEVTFGIRQQDAEAWIPRSQRPKEAAPPSQTRKRVRRRAAKTAPVPS
jgi:hypothetical protein